MSLFPDYITDVHTHTPRPGAIVNVAPGDVMEPALRYSVSIHPWDVGSATEADWARLERIASSPLVLAVGETGIDALRGPAAEEQESAFRRHIALSERLGKPLIIHAVKSIDRILAIKRELRPAQPWIVHGFRGKPEQARQLVNAGLYLSLGARFNPAVPAAVPADRLLRESD